MNYLQPAGILNITDEITSRGVDPINLHLISIMFSFGSTFQQTTSRDGLLK